MANKPYVVVEWNDTETDAKGWMCAYNFVGHYCGGGTRMHPTVTKEEVIRLATTMGYKYKACESATTCTDSFTGVLVPGLSIIRQ